MARLLLFPSKFSLIIAKDASMRLLLLVVLVAGFVGCGDSGPTISKPDEFAPVAPEATAGQGGEAPTAPPVVD
jgi:hypothetical protein